MLWIFFSGHPRFFNQLSSGLDIIGLAGEWLTSTANTNMWVFPSLRSSCQQHVCLCYIYASVSAAQRLCKGFVWALWAGGAVFLSGLYRVMSLNAVTGPLASGCVRLHIDQPVESHVLPLQCAISRANWTRAVLSDISVWWVAHAECKGALQRNVSIDCVDTLRGFFVPI